MKAIQITSITDSADKLSDKQKASFTEQSNIVAFEMASGDSLWRIVSTKNGKKFSDCWVDSETMKGLMGVFRSWGDYSQKAKKQVVRDNLAIISPWSQLNWRVKITFKKPVIAYKGKTGPQNHFIDDAKLSERYKSKVQRSVESRIGGFDQYVIPRFKGVTADMGSEYADITHFAHI